MVSTSTYTSPSPLTVLTDRAIEVAEQLPDAQVRRNLFKITYVKRGTVDDIPQVIGIDLVEPPVPLPPSNCR
jgi:hypothetical protein